MSKTPYQQLSSMRILIVLALRHCQIRKFHQVPLRFVVLFIAAAFWFPIGLDMALAKKLVAPIQHSDFYIKQRPAFKGFFEQYPQAAIFGSVNQPVIYNPRICFTEIGNYNRRRIFGPSYDGTAYFWIASRFKGSSEIKVKIVERFSSDYSGEFGARVQASFLSGDKRPTEMMLRVYECGNVVQETTLNKNLLSLTEQELIPLVGTEHGREIFLPRHTYNDESIRRLTKKGLYIGEGGKLSLFEEKRKCSDSPEFNRYYDALAGVWAVDHFPKKYGVSINSSKINHGNINEVFTVTIRGSWKYLSNNKRVDEFEIVFDRCGNLIIFREIK